MAGACPICGHQLEWHEGTYVYSWPEGTGRRESRFADAEWETCGHCDEEFLTGELVERIEQQRYEVDGLLTPPEIKAIRERLGLSQVAMAKQLGIGDKTYARWESGLCVQNRSMDNLIRIADSNPDIFLRIEERRNPDRYQDIARYIEQLGTTKPQDQLGLAAHGEQPHSGNAEVIHAKLRSLIASRDGHEQ